MSIRIVPEAERSPGVDPIAPLVLPAADLPYARRAARLRTLAQGHVMTDYLLWSADLVDTLQQIGQAAPLPEAEGRMLAQALHHAQGAPLDSGRWQRSAHWQALLQQLLDLWQAQARMQTAPLQQTLQTLAQANTAQREAWADALLAALRGDAASTEQALPEAGVAQLLWMALSLYWRQLASQLPGAGMAELGEQRQLCPVCGHGPTGSLVLAGAQAGLRYLQCSLCESQWHMVRTKCSCCESTEALDYWSQDSEKSAIKAESCGDCHSYLKAFYLQADHQLDLVADDLASLALDADMEDQGLARSGINPLLLPGLA